MLKGIGALGSCLKAADQLSVSGGRWSDCIRQFRSMDLITCKFSGRGLCGPPGVLTGGAVCEISSVVRIARRRQT